MRELCELSLQERKRLVVRVTEVMGSEFQISSNSIGTFWNMLEIGQKMHEMA